MWCRIEPDNRLSRISKCCARIWLTLFAALTLLACGIDDSALITTQPGGTTNMSFSPPSPVLILRALDLNQLHLIVRINGQEISTTRESDEQWVATTLVQPDSTVSAEVIWIVQGLEVAKATKQVSVSSEGATVSFTSSEFNTSMDKDEDGRSNLAEFDAGTDPWDGDSPGQVLNDVSLALKFELPLALENASPSSIDALFVEASVNDEGVSVTRNGNLWSADASVSLDSSAFVSVAFYTSDQRDIQIAAFQGSESVGNGGAITVNANSYNTDFDHNSDGISNAEEFVNSPNSEETGDDPEESSNEPGETGDDPEETTVAAAAACAISNFEPGCDNDRDSDGIPDSVEGRIDDADEDSIPDYRESALIDEDEDGTAAQFDTDDVNDPCTPSNVAEACLLESRDSDGDGKLDIEEGDKDTDGDEDLDRDESSKDDRDDDGTVDELDSDDSDPCIPSRDNPNCRVRGG